MDSRLKCSGVDRPKFGANLISDIIADLAAKLVRSVRCDKAQVNRFVAVDLLMAK